jgi:hypothetical protein
MGFYINWMAQKVMNNSSFFPEKFQTPLSLLRLDHTNLPTTKNVLVLLPDRDGPKL